jgi:aquaporin Z
MLAERAEHERREIMMNRLGAEFIGTFWLTLGGCGSAVLAAAFPEVGIGLTGVSFAFGLTLLTMAYAIGHISAQVGGAIVAAIVLYLIASGKPGFEVGGFAANGYGEHSPGGYSLGAALICEVVMTFMFLLVILGATDPRAPAGFAGLPIGLALVLIHLISIPVTNTSVNPARSTGPAVIVGGWALQKLWLFWVAPIVGAALAGVVHRGLFAREERT